MYHIVQDRNVEQQSLKEVKRIKGTFVDSHYQLFSVKMCAASPDDVHRLSTGVRVCPSLAISINTVSLSVWYGTSPDIIGRDSEESVPYRWYGRRNPSRLKGNKGGIDDR